MTLLAGLADTVTAMQGRFDEALALVDRAVSIGEEFGLTFQLARIRDHTAAIHLLRGALRRPRRSSGSHLTPMGSWGRRGDGRPTSSSWRR